MGSIKAVVEFHPVDGLAEDIAVNTYAVETPGAAAGADHFSIAAAFVELYTSVPPNGGTKALGEYLGPMVSRTQDEMAVLLYDIDGKLDGSPHGSPIYVAQWTVPAAQNASPLPEETALCVTLRGLGWQTALVEVPDGDDPGVAKDRPKQRRSGRTYLGPLNGDASQSANGRAKPHDDFRTNTHLAFTKLQDHLITEAQSYLSVWSKQDSALYRVTHVQTDDAWDTQRRRGRAPTTRGTVQVYAP